MLRLGSAPVTTARPYFPLHFSPQLGLNIVKSVFCGAFASPLPFWCPLSPFSIHVDFDADLYGIFIMPCHTIKGSNV